MGIVITTIWLALIDAFDPCMFAIYSALLISASMISINRVCMVGPAFIISSYIGYFIFGLLLRHVSLSLPRYVLAAATVVYGVVMLLHSLIWRTVEVDGVCREGDVVCRIGRVLKLDVFVYRGAVFVFLIGFIAAFTLFPCTAGMYIVFNVLTAELGFVEWLSLALVYVTVFTSPLILILLSFIGIVKLKNIHHTLLLHQNLIKLAGSVLLIAASIYILATSPPTTFSTSEPFT